QRWRTEIRVLTSIGVPLQATAGYSAPEVEESYTRAYELCQKLKTTHEQFPILYGLFRYYMLQARYPKARELSAQLLQIAGNDAPLHFVVAANRAGGGPPVYEGRHAEAVPLLERVVAIPPTPELRADVYRYDVVDPWIAARSYLSWACWLQGRIDESIQHSNEAVRIAEALDHSFSQALALSFSQWVHQFRRDVARTRQTADQAFQIATDHSFAFWIGWCRIMRGWAMAYQNAVIEGIREIEQGIREWRATGSELGCHYYYALLAEACLLGDQFPEAADALQHAQSFADQTGEGFWISEITRLRGRLTLKTSPDDLGSAESSFRKAIEQSAAQGAASLRLRATVDLCHLLAKSNRRTEAFSLLQIMTDQITEGFDTVDVREARELLHELSTR
ncbi:MAG: hypothetical protein KDA85_06820, partial [Planctomycetaceae bacterium]|nr:hypothetical protein [Planctomycetaceae bacterium]